MEIPLDVRPWAHRGIFVKRSYLVLNQADIRVLSNGSAKLLITMGERFVIPVKLRMAMPAVLHFLMNRAEFGLLTLHIMMLYHIQICLIIFLYGKNVQFI